MDGQSPRTPRTSLDDFRTPQASVTEEHIDATPTRMKRPGNPYLERGYPDGPTSGRSSLHDFPSISARPEAHAADRASQTPPHGHENTLEGASPTDPHGENSGDGHSSRQSTSTRRGLSSIRGFLRRASQSSRRSEHGEGIPEEPEETAETLQKKMEDPQHLLDTILEDNSDQQLMPVGEAAQEVLNHSDSSVLQNDPTLYKRRQGYRDNLLRTRRLRKTTKASRTVALLRRWWQAIMQWSLISRIFFYWLPIAAILFVPLAVGEWQNKEMRLGGTRVFWIFIWLAVAWASLFVGKIFAHYMPELCGYLISIFIPTYFKYVDALLALELPIQLLIFTFVTFISFTPILWDNSDAVAGEERPHWQRIIQDVCVAFLVSAIIFFVEQIFLYIVSTGFHRERLSLRIERQKKSVNVLTILLDTSFAFFPRGCDEFDEEDSALKHAAINRAQKHTKTRNRVLQTVNKAVGNASKNVSNFVENATQVESKPSAAKIVKNALTNRDTREVLACRIWKALVMEDENALTYQGLISVFGLPRKEEVLFMFDILDLDGADGIDLDEMIESVNRIGKESKQISRSLVDMNGAIRKLHYLLMSIALILVIVIFVGMLAPSSGTTIATLGSTLISLSWLFQSSAQEVFQSCVFLFVKHPYDIGDWIETTVPTLGIVRMNCIQLNLTYSVFTQIGVQTRHQVAHSVLNSQFISNITRSPPSQVNIVMTIGIPETTPEQLDEFAERLEEFAQENPRDYAPGIFLHPIGQTELDRMDLNVCIATRCNQSDIVQFSIKRTKALEFISQCIHEIPITLPRREEDAQNDPAVPVFQYNIKDFDEAMAYADKARGRRRLVGMEAPKLMDDDDNVNDGTDSEVAHVGDFKSSAMAASQFQRRRRNSNTSRATGMSRITRRMSVSSRYSNAVGLRTRNTVIHPTGEHIPPTETSKDV